MRLACIDIRKAARDDLQLHTGDYFKLLSMFIKNAPQIKKSLENISAQSGDENDYKCIELHKSLFDSIGCEKYVALITEIIRVGKRGHSDFAAEQAKLILSGFDELYNGLIAAKKEEKQTNITGVLNAEDTTYENYKTQFLQKTLKLIEHEEATRKLRILAVDDAPIVLKTIMTVLSDEYKVFGMTDPTKMKEFLQQNTPELFLLDYKMPELSGFDLVPIIRSFEEHKDTPIIFLTSMGTFDHVSSAFSLGACDFIVKPFQGNILREKIEKHIVRKRLF
uniref:Two component transcriptional regulator, winged helix family n=1 Tax=uncultured bacterium contig00030 TaxID=1181519 RepID=A0A806K0R8_9BACT|nr:two component transcriptional regulator, winged helix family [uncultured bacterium contig00030]